MPSDITESTSSIPSTVSDHRLAMLVDLLPDTVLLLDAEGRVRWGNEAAERLFGRKREDSVGTSVLEFIHEDDLELVIRSLASVQEKDVGTLIEVRVDTPSGWKLVEVIGRPVPEVGQGCLLFCIRDVTERRRFEVAGNSVAKFRSLVQNAAFVTMLVSGHGTIESASAALTRLFGHDPETVEGHPVSELFGPADRPSIDHAFEAASKRGRSFGPLTVDAGCSRGNSTELVPVELTIVSLLEDPTVGGFVVSMRDITERTLAERELRKTLSLLTGTLESTADGIFVVDRHGAIVGYNQRFADLWGIPDEVLGSRDEAQARSLVTEQLSNPDGFASRVDELNSTPEAESFDTLACRDGRLFECYSKPQRVGDEIVGRVWSFRDVTERKQLEEALAYRASHDHLTGLANRDLFLEQLQRSAARGDQGRKVAVLFVDVDGLKRVNDRLGHVAGDELLVKVARVLRSSTRLEDLVGRLGGDEFSVLVQGITSQSDVVSLAERILDGLPKQFTRGEASIKVSLSVGISFVEPDLSYLDVLRHADIAMYSAKQRGGGCWELAAHG
jgi:diguanylate cyclase (GGDEF)-like protein/PAS domain S-box-containing protein